jgi:hypothetical protein
MTNQVQPGRVTFIILGKGLYIGNYPPPPPGRDNSRCHLGKNYEKGKKRGNMSKKKKEKGKKK